MLHRVRDFDLDRCAASRAPRARSGREKLGAAGSPASICGPQSGEGHHRDTGTAFVPQVPGLARLLGLTYAKFLRRLLSKTLLAAIRGDGRSQSIILLRWDRSPLLARWLPRALWKRILGIATKQASSALQRVPIDRGLTR